MATLSVGLEAKTTSDAAAALDFDTLPRTYESALHLLSLLSTNRDVTSLFEAPPADDKNKNKIDYNALAIPEVVAWMGRAGYTNLGKDLAPLKCIHVAGTKGKGSVCAFATAVLVASRGETTSIGRVGTYLSPHVVSVRERIWLDGKPISRDLFARYTFELWQRLSEGATTQNPKDPQPYGPHTKPFYFRFLTLLALHVFLREGVRSAVVECGIGGEYDATNILPASSVTATAVTRLGIDHVAMLGRTLDEIAWHKAGIFKPGVAAFTLQGTPSSSGEVLAVLRARAAEKKSLGGTLYEVSPASVAAWDGVPGAALAGSFQKYNMALAAAVARYHIRAVTSTSTNTEVADLLDPATIPHSYCTALSKASLRARCEVVSLPQQAVDYVVDGAHTTDSLAEVAQFFAARVPTADSKQSRRILIFSVRDRSPGDLLRAVIVGAGPDGFFHEARLVSPPDAPLQREDVCGVMHDVSPSTAVTIHSSVRDALSQVQAQAQAQDAAGTRRHVLVAGSFVLARDVLQELDASLIE